MNAQRFVPTVVAIVALVPMGCSSGGAPPSGAGSGASNAVDVIASFYPLAFMAERIGGARVRVENMTPAGTEPHELELTARSTAALEDADLIVYLSGFAPAVDEAIDAVGGDHALDVRDAAALDLTYTPIEDGEQAADDAEATDPHFWLDPTRLAGVIPVVVDRLSEVDVDDAAVFRTNADALLADLTELDRDMQSGLAQCASTVIVTSHNAFGYLAERYGMTQIGITGLTPEDEPSPGDLAAVSAFVEAHEVRTIYSETLVSPAIADTIAAETGAATAVLDPIEGLSADSQGGNYLEIMRADLAELRAGQGCE